MTAAHKRHPTAATNGAGHGEASSSGQRGGRSARPLAFAACVFEGISRFRRGLAATQGDRPVIDRRRPPRPGAMG